MPIYDFQCPADHRWEAVTSFEAAKEGMACPECGEAGQKAFSAAFSMGVPKTFSMNRRRKMVDERKQRRDHRIEEKVASGEMTQDQVWAMADAGKKSNNSPYLMDPQKDGKDLRPAAVEKREKSTGFFDDQIDM